MSESESESDADLNPQSDAQADAPNVAPPPPGAGYQTSPTPIRLFRSEDLFGGGRIVWIEHAGGTYRLQITARGRLILQK